MISCIFVGSFTIFFFFLIGKQDRLSCDDRLSFEDRLLLKHTKTLSSSFPGVFAYHSTTVYHSFVQKTLLSSIPGVFVSHSTTVNRSNVQKHWCRLLQGVRLSVDDHLVFKHTNTVGCHSMVRSHRMISGYGRLSLHGGLGAISAPERRLLFPSFLCRFSNFVL